MAANEFEKKMQRILDEFKIHPSGEVWQNVEKTIRERKRKRRIIFFLVFSCLGLLMAGYAFNHFTQGNQQKSDLGNKKNGTEVQNKHVKNEQAPIQNIQTKNDDQKIADRDNSVQTIKIIKNEKPANNKFYNNEHLPHNIGTIAKTSKRDDNKNGKKIPGETVSNNTQPGTIAGVSATNDKINSADSMVSRSNIVSRQDDNSTNMQLDSSTKKNVDAKTNKIDSAIARVTKPKVESNESQKLEWGVSVSAGPSIIKDKFLLAGIGKKANLSAYSPGVYGGSGTPGAAFNTQLGNQSSFAFKAGVVIKRTISKRSSLSTGLTYAYLTDKIHIGFKQSNNSLLAGLMSISTYYGGTGQTTFIDRFHFIELPLLFNWRLTADPRHFLSLDAGISVSYLVSTNALVYDTTGFGIYYHKNDQFAKGNISLLTGLSYHMVKKGFEWNIGPQFSFQLNKIIKSDFDERKYFLYTGIEGTIFFGKKKNK